MVGRFSILKIRDRTEMSNSHTIEQKRMIQGLLREAKRRAKEKNLEFNIQPEDIPWADQCPILQVKLERNKGNVQTNSPTLDRVNSKFGYVKGNVQIISWRANLLKGNLSLDEAERLVQYMKGEL